MREIFFRGKRIDNGEWVEGFYLNHKNVAHYIIPCDYGGYESMTGDFYVHEWHRVDPESIGQYTGLCDKNGKIFEGDIFEWGYAAVKEFRYVIVYDAELTSFVGERHFGFVSLNGVDIEVIGNIHDNPELLEVDNGT